jgi:hypothetical protein
LVTEDQENKTSPISITRVEYLEGDIYKKIGGCQEVRNERSRDTVRVGEVSGGLSTIFGQVPKGFLTL